MNAPHTETVATASGGVFVSDLHLFSPRSDADYIPAELAATSSDDRCIVLGGDIFDFRWSIRGSHELTLAAAVHWLEELLERTGLAHIRFIPGNHDSHPEFLQLLTQLSQREPRFEWYEHHFQLGNTLFLHGDILDARGNLSSYREKFHHEHPQTGFKHTLYDGVVALRLHKLVPLLRHRPKLTCQRLLGLVDSLPPVSERPVERVYFGHTHAPIFGHEARGIRFFNPGAALKHMRAHPQYFEFDQPVALHARVSQ
jgi:UDP-2,3-diacylglucosamine pyrophosphatase LpxH